MTQDPAAALDSGSNSEAAPPPHSHHFATDHLVADLKGRSVRGGAVTLTAQAIKFALQMGSTMALARLLLPSDFGLIAMVTAITGFVAMFKDAGLSMATVQRKDITHDQVSTLFWINVALSAAVMIVVAAMAPLIAAFYSEPRLVWVTVALAGTMLFGGFTVQHQALLQRQMRFKSLAVIEIASMAGSIAVAITMGLMNFGYWSLVGMTISAAVTNAALAWAICNWRPGRPKRNAGTRDLLKFGTGLLGFNFVNYAARNADNILLGWSWGAGPLGLYTKAYGLLLLPLRQISAPIASVLIPAMSRCNERPREFSSIYFLGLRFILYAAFPIISVLAIYSDAVIHIVLGENWSNASPIFRILCIGACLQPIVNTFGWIYISEGRTGEMFRAGILCSTVYVLSFAVGLPFGPTGVAFGWSISLLLIAPYLLWNATRLSSISAIDFIINLKRPAIVLTLSSCTALAIREIDSLPAELSIIIASLAASCISGITAVSDRECRSLAATFKEGILARIPSRLAHNASTAKINHTQRHSEQKETPCDE